MSNSSSSRLRVVLVVVGMLAVALASGYLFMNRFPNAFDRESVDLAEVERLKSAKLTESTAKAETGWPQWRGPNRDGRAPAGPFRSDWDKHPIRELWSVPCKGGYASCAVTGGRLYTMEYDSDQKSERLICINANDGTPLWELAATVDYRGIGYGAGPRATPTVHDGRVYFVGATGQFACADADPQPGQPPREYWRHDLIAEFQAAIPKWGVACSPLIENDLVIVQPGGRLGSVVAFDRISGEKRWASGKNVNGYSSPIAATIAGERMIIAMTGNALLGLRAADGRELFSHPWVTQFEGNIATPIVVDDYIFISSGYGKGCALLLVEKRGDEFRAKPVYFRPGKLMKNHHSTCVHRNGYLYGFDDGTLRCINLREGTEVWDARGLNKGSLILFDQFLVGLTESGTLFLAEANPEEFKLLYRKDNALRGPECWALPVLTDGKLYLRDSSRIICWDVAN